MFSPLFKYVVLSLTLFSSALSSPVADPIATDSLSPRQSEQHQGEATYFFQGGNPGACGQVHSDQDHIVALQTMEYANGAHCGKTISITYPVTGKTATATVADQCAGCGAKNNIDLSEGLFQVFASTDLGRIPVAWNFV